VAVHEHGYGGFYVRCRIVPEFWKRATVQRRAGFTPNHFDDTDGDVELMQIWCRQADGDEYHRATTDDLRAAGFVKRKTKARRKS
jgi:hypothetical protein